MANTKDTKASSSKATNDSVTDAVKEQITEQSSKKKDNSFASMVYDEISAAIGGSNGNQFLCLQLPGTILYAEDYSYDVEQNKPKPLVVEANESRLANKMFDPCRITSTDNGFTLPYQYKAALDLLSPKLNRNLSNFKNRLRQLLLSEYPYDFGDGVETKYTPQQVYFKLYEDYINEINEWSKIKSQKKAELREKYKLPSEYNEAYLDWYETESEKYENEINEKKAKVLTVLSPSDMKILEGALDCGSGAELQEARESLKSVSKPIPSGGYVYPVQFSPPNWFRMIGSSFTSSDLMKGADALATDLQDYSLRRMQLCTYIENIASIIADDSSFKDQDVITLIDKVKKSKGLLDSAERLAISQLFRFSKTNSESGKVSNPKITVSFDKEIPEYTDEEIKRLLIPITDIQGALGKRMTRNIITNLANRANVGDLIDDDGDSILFDNNGQISRISTRRKNYIEDITTLEKTLDEKIEASTEGDIYHEFADYLTPIKSQLKTINQKINSILEQIKYSSGLQLSTQDDLSSKSLIPNGFTQVTIETDISSLDTESEYTKSRGVSTRGIGLRRVGKSTSTTQINDTYSSLFKDCTIKIVMNVAKIGIERDWFNPGIFALTKDMIKLGKNMISPSKDDYDGITDQRLKDMENCIFPCYPVAMVLARDISINFEFAEQTSLSEQYKFIEKQTLSGGGFLMFRNMSGNSTIQNTSSHVSLQKQSIMVKIDSTQLIGYYLEATRPDQSIPFDSISRKVKETESISTISEYAGDYTAMINSSITKMKENNITTLNTGTQAETSTSNA
jgi:hypothetical protein